MKCRRFESFTFRVGEVVLPPEGKCIPLVLACLVMKAADASVNGDSVDGHASWV